VLKRYKRVLIATKKQDIAIDENISLRVKIALRLLRLYLFGKIIAVVVFLIIVNYDIIIVTQLLSTIRIAFLLSVIDSPLSSNTIDVAKSVSIALRYF